MQMEKPDDKKKEEEKHCIHRIMDGLSDVLDIFFIFILYYIRFFLKKIENMKTDLLFLPLSFFFPFALCYHMLHTHLSWKKK